MEKLLPIDIVNIIRKFTIKVIGIKGRLVCKEWRDLIKLLNIDISYTMSLSTYASILANNDIDTMKIRCIHNECEMPFTMFKSAKGIKGPRCIIARVWNDPYAIEDIVEFLSDNKNILSSVEELDVDFMYNWEFSSLKLAIIDLDNIAYRRRGLYAYVKKRLADKVIIRTTSSTKARSLRWLAKNKPWIVVERK
jgi:hypothetical protein